MSEHPFEPLQFTELPQEEMILRSRQFYEEMNRRRTVREFCDRPVPREVIENAVHAAGTAPSGAHKQPWQFVMVGDPAIKSRIREAAEVEERESYEHRMPQTWLEDLAPLGTDWRKEFLTTCPWLIVVFQEVYGLDPDSDGKKKHYYTHESVGISVGLLLAALHHSGVATLTHTPSPMGFLQKILNRPNNERAYMLIGVGYPGKGCKVPAIERKPLESILTEI